MDRHASNECAIDDSMAILLTRNSSAICVCIINFADIELCFFVHIFTKFLLLSFADIREMKCIYISVIKVLRRCWSR